MRFRLQSPVSRLLAIAALLLSPFSLLLAQTPSKAVSANPGTGELIWPDKETFKLINGIASGMSNPMTALGDLIVGGIGGAPARLGIGLPGYVLAVNVTADGVVWIPAPTGGGGGTGTVTSFSAGALAPLFTTSVATPTTTPALSFSLSSQSANRIFAGPVTGGAAAPTFRALVPADVPDLSGIYLTPGAANAAYVPVTRTVNSHPLNADVIVTKADVGLGNVDNTSDANKPISTATQTALNAKVGTGSVTTSGLTMTTARLLGRTTAAAGAVEEISIGAGLSLNAGVLSATGGATGTVTSVGLALPSIFAITGSPVTTSGTLSATFVTQAANTIFAGPATGVAAAPTFRALVAADIPALPYQPTGNYITALTGDVTAAGPGSAAATLATVNSSVGTFGSASLVPVITVNAKGLVTSITTQAVTLGANNLTGTTLAANVVNASFNSITPTGGTLAVTGALTLTTPLAVTSGGTGRATGTTAYGLLAAGTTATGAQQTLAAGATTEILVGGGASALPVWTTATGSGAPVRATSPVLDTPTANSASANALTINRTAGGSADIRFQRAGVDKGYIADNGGGITIYDAAAVGRAAVTSIGLAVTGNISTDGTVSARNSGVLLSGSAANPYIQLSDTVGASYLEVSGGVLRLVPRAGQTASITASLAVTGSISATSRFTIGSGAGTGALYNAGFTSAQEGAGFTSSDDGSGATFASFRKASGAVIGSINRVGTTDAVAYNTTSDVRLKTNVRDFTAAASGRIIDGLRPRLFDWKSAKDADGKGIIGFIAQEEAAVGAELIRIGAVTPGDPDATTITKQWQRSDAALVPILVAELKALRARMAKLEGVK